MIIMKQVIINWNNLSNETDLLTETDLVSLTVLHILDEKKRVNSNPNA